jgi:hypothetical protein
MPTLHLFNKKVPKNLRKKMKKIILLFIAISGFEISKTFSLIVIYGSPDKTPHLLEAGIFFLAGAVFISSFFYNIESTLTIVWKWVYSIVGIIILIESLPLIYILFDDKRISMLVNNLTIWIFIFANLIILVSLFFAIKNNFKKVTYEK